MPVLGYVSQTAQGVRVNYADMPADTEAVFVNTTSGTKTPSASNALNNGGSGSADIPIEPSLPAGSYYLLAQGRQSKQNLAQTVPFYISRGSGEGK